MSEPPPKKSKTDENVEDSTIVVYNIEDEYSASEEILDRTGTQPVVALAAGLVDNNIDPLREPVINFPSAPSEYDGQYSDHRSQMEPGEYQALDEEINDFIEEISDTFPSPSHQNVYHEADEKAVSISQQSTNGVDNQSGHMGFPNHGRPLNSVSDISQASNLHPMNDRAFDRDARGHLLLAPRPLDVASRPVNYPSEQRQTRCDGNGYGCAVCGRKKKDCDKGKCMLPLIGPGLFLGENGILYYFRKRADVLMEGAEAQNDDNAEQTETVRVYCCTECKKPIKSAYHQQICIKRPGNQFSLANDGKTEMVGFPISSKPCHVDDIAPELIEIEDEVFRDLRDFWQLPASTAEDDVRADAEVEDEEEGRKRKRDDEKKCPPKK